MKNVPLVRWALASRDSVQSDRKLGVRLMVPNGHFYSPIPSLRDVRFREAEIFEVPDEVPGVDLRAGAQLAFLRELGTFYDEQPFAASATEGLRYYFDNEMFGRTDALVLHSMLRQFRPRRFVEVGSGFSSAVALDTNDRFLGGQLECTFVEPYTDRLRSLLRGDDARRCHIIEQSCQSVDLSVFDQLESGDFLFIDSTHVSKIGSDVNRLFFDVLPRLAPGVIVHVHDIFYPFEYPKEWVYEGRAWNEAYLLRALLIGNASYRMLLWNSYLGAKHTDTAVAAMPLWRDGSGGSIWLERVG